MQEEARDNKLMKKQQEQNSKMSHWEFTLTSPETIHPQKRFNRPQPPLPPQSLAGLTNEGISLNEGSL